MADFKISQLDAMSASDIGADDVIIINDGNTTTKTATLTELFGSDEVKDLIAGGDGSGSNTPDDRYLRLDGGAEAQTVATRETTTFTGVVDTGSGLSISGGTASNVGNGLFAGGNALYIGFASQGSRIGRMEKYTGSNGGDAYRFSLDNNDDGLYKENSRTGISRGVNASFELNASGTFFFNQLSNNQSNISNYLCTSSDGEGGTSQASLSILNSINAGGDITSNYFANLDAALEPRSVTLNLGAYATGDLSNVPLKIGIGQTNTQITPDYIRIAGAFPDKDTSDDSYSQLAQNFVAIRGDFNTRFQTRGAGLSIKNLYIPDYLDADGNVIPPANLPNPIDDGEGGFKYAEPEFAGIRVARMGHAGDFATNPITLSEIQGLRVDNDTGLFYNNKFPYSGDESDPGPIGVEQISGVSTSVNASSHPDRLHFNFNSEGSAPNFFAGDTHIGGTTSSNTRKLWESTLTEEQQEQLEAGTLTIPANVSTPGDGSFVRQWWYYKQSAEDQALIDSGELDYPKNFQAANFTDTFTLGENTTIDLNSKFGVVHANGIAFDKTNANVSHVNYSGFYRGGSTKGPILTTTPSEDGDNIVVLKLNPFAYLPDTNTNVRLESCIGLDVSPPTTTAGSNETSVVDQYKAISVRSFGQSVLNTNGLGIGVESKIANYTSDGRSTYNFYADGNAPNFFRGDTYIGGSTARNTFDLWKSTLTEEQQEQLSAGTLAIPANVSTPGDGSFVRQWWYDQQSAEDQALIDSGELDYPERYQAANFVDTSELGIDTNIDLLSTGEAHFGGNVGIGTKTPTDILTIKCGNFLANRDGGLRFTLNDINDESEKKVYRAGIKSDATGQPRFFIDYASDSNGDSAEALCIANNTGYVGIGTTAPQSELDVDGSIKSRGSVWAKGAIHINGYDDGLVSGIGYNSAASKIVLNVEGRDNDNNLTGNPSNILRLSSGHNVNDNQIAVGGDITISSTTGEISILGKDKMYLIHKNTLYFNGNTFTPNIQWWGYKTETDSDGKFPNTSVNTCFIYPSVKDSVFNESDPGTWLESYNIFNLGFKRTEASEGYKQSNIKSKTAVRIGNTLGTPTWPGSGIAVNYGVRSQLGGDSNYNIYCEGTSPNLMNGGLAFGNSTNIAGSTSIDEILNYYERGTFVPVLNYSRDISDVDDGSATLVSQHGNYIIVGNQVTVQVFFKLKDESGDPLNGFLTGAEAFSFEAFLSPNNAQLYASAAGTSVVKYANNTNIMLGSCRFSGGKTISLEFNTPSGNNIPYEEAQFKFTMTFITDKL